MKILSNKKYNDMQETMNRQSKLINSLKKENAILNQAIVAQNIDFPNGAVKSTEIDVKV